MAGEMTMPFAKWEMLGLVLEKRILKSAKANSNWTGWVVKVQTMGLTADVTVNEKDYEQIIQGGSISCIGHFEVQGTATKLVMDKYQQKAA